MALEEFWALPNEISLDKIPRLSAEIILLNMRPMDLFSKWPHEADSLVQHIVTFKDNLKLKCSGNFILNLDNTFWVKQVQKWKKLENDDQLLEWSLITDIKERLKIFSNDFQEHSERLLHLCQKSSVDPFKYVHLEKFVKSIEEKSLKDYLDGDVKNKSIRKLNVQEIIKVHRYAFFEPEQFEILVKITEIIDPTHFYVNIFKFETQLNKLQSDLKKEYDVFEGDIDLIQDQIYICQYDDQYCRVKYLNEEEVLFVDYGSIEKFPNTRLVPISRTLHDQLPFQAIKCSLKNIVPNGDYWSDEALNTFEENLDCFFAVIKPLKITDENYEGYSYQITSMTCYNLGEDIGIKLHQEGHCQYLGNIIPKMIPEYIEEVKPVASNEVSHVKKDIISKNGPIIAKNEHIKVKPIKSFKNKLPDDMPNLEVPEENIDFSKYPDETTWGQKSQVEICFTFKILGPEVIPNQAWIVVGPKNLEFSYLDIIQDETGQDIYSLVQIPKLTLFSEVMPQETRIKFSPQAVEVRLKKAKSLFWPKPCINTLTNEPVKYSWMKTAEMCFDSDDEDELELEDKSIAPVRYDYVKDVDTDEVTNSNEEITSDSQYDSDYEIFG